MFNCNAIYSSLGHQRSFYVLGINPFDHGFFHCTETQVSASQITSKIPQDWPFKILNSASL